MEVFELRLPNLPSAIAASLIFWSTGWPGVERDPRRHIMAERNREKLMLHLSQSMVWL